MNVPRLNGEYHSSWAEIRALNMQKQCFCWTKNFKVDFKKMCFGSVVACSVTVFSGELTLHAHDRLFVYFRVIMDGEGRGKWKASNFYYPSLLPLLPSNHRSSLCILIALPSLLLPSKSKTATTIFIKNILGTRSQNLCLLCRLVGEVCSTWNPLFDSFCKGKN